MVQFNDWCVNADTPVGAHTLYIVTADPARRDLGIAVTAAAVPGHYAAEEHVARMLARLGKPQAAAFIEGKLPTTKQIRSGDLGEIYATEWIAAHGGYQVPIKRLRWKDHRNMAMRGDDVIGIAQAQPNGPIQFLKTEAKSRVSLTAGVVAEARARLDKDGGLPSAHALSFISERLLELGNQALADAIDDAQFKTGITAVQVRRRSSERLMARLGMPVSDTTILRSVKERAGAPPNRAEVRVAGVDESLRAKDDETKTCREFTLGGIGQTSRGYASNQRQQDSCGSRH